MRVPVAHQARQQPHVIIGLAKDPGPWQRSFQHTEPARCAECHPNYGPYSQMTGHGRPITHYDGKGGLFVGLVPPHCWDVPPHCCSLAPPFSPILSLSRDCRIGTFPVFPLVGFFRLSDTTLILFSFPLKAALLPFWDQVLSLSVSFFSRSCSSALLPRLHCRCHCTVRQSHCHLFRYFTFPHFLSPQSGLSRRARISAAPRLCIFDLTSPAINSRGAPIGGRERREVESSSLLPTFFIHRFTAIPISGPLPGISTSSSSADNES